MWAYEHFKNLFIGYKGLQVCREYQPTMALSHKYVFDNKPQINKERFLEMRLSLDSYDVRDVVFDPYRIDREVYFQSPANVSFYNGPLFHPKGFVMHNPFRIMRQLGYKQKDLADTSHHKFSHEFHRCQSDESHTIVAYDPEPVLAHWNEREEEELVLSDGEDWEIAETGYETSPTFLRAHLEYSHPYVVRPDHVEVPPQPERPSATTTPTTVPELIQLVTLLVSTQ